MPGAVQVDLSRMDRILRIDRRNRLALIEPGVTFDALVPALAGRVCASRCRSSPARQVRDREPARARARHRPALALERDWSRCERVEIIWGNGERLFTGNGQTRSGPRQDWEHGPRPAAWRAVRASSTSSGCSRPRRAAMGIATWASVKCEPVSDASNLLFIPPTGSRTSSDCAYELLKIRFGDETFIVNAVTLAHPARGRAGERARLAASLPRWMLVVGIGGGSILGAREARRPRGGHPRDRRSPRPRGPRRTAGTTGAGAARRGCRTRRPSRTGATGPRRASEEIFFLTTLDRAHGFVDTVAGRRRAAMPEPVRGIGVYLQPIHMGAGLHCEFILPFDRPTPAPTRRAESSSTSAAAPSSEQGAYFCRPYGEWADWSSTPTPATAARLGRSRTIFDPNHVMNPGKLCFSAALD